MRRIAVVVLALSVGAALLVRADVAWACSCVEGTTSRAYLRGADVAFVGEVATVERAEPVIATLSVDVVYKGAVESVVTVQTPASGAECGVAFVPGTTYTVFGDLREGAWWADSCRTHADGDTLAPEGVAPLITFPAPGQDEQVAAGSVPPEPASDRRTGPIAAAIMVLAAVLVGRVLAWRSRRPRASSL